MTGHHVERAARHFEDADGADRIAVLRCALLQVERQLGHTHSGITAAVHGGGVCVAGHAKDIHHAAHAAVDRGDDAERQVQLVQHRALFDMHLDKAEVIRRVALEFGDVVHTQPGVLHGLAHGDAVGVFLVQPLGFEIANECAGAEESGLVTLAFFFGKTDHLEVERQAFALAVEFTHTGHGHKDAEAAVVFAAVAHRVVVATGHQGFGVGLVGLVAAHHVAHGVDLDLVKAAVAHPVRDALGAGTVRVREVGHGELAFFGEAGVRVGAEFFLPIPHVVAQRGRRTKLVVQANLGDAVDVAQRLGTLEVRVVVQPPLKCGDDLLLSQAGAAWAAHRQDEGETEFGTVGGVEFTDVRQLFGGAVCQACLALLVGALGGERVALHLFSGQLGVHVDQHHLLRGRGRAHGLRQGVFQVLQRLHGARREGLLGHPGGVFVNAVEQGDKVSGRGGVELVDGEGHVRLPRA